SDVDGETDITFYFTNTDRCWLLEKTTAGADGVKSSLKKRTYDEKGNELTYEEDDEIDGKWDYRKTREFDCWDSQEFGGELVDD
ncbi:MAG: hypothetical protein GY854_21950, partial [Deltaproteobacteria bacterium]|nr:hypothetical protein [Deltaproteobacteria bacterium]